VRFTPQTIRAFVPDVDLPYRSSMVYTGIFTPRQCERIVALGLGLTADDAMVGAGSKDHVSEHATRLSRTAWIDADDEHMWIFDKLARVAQRANRVYGFDLLGFTESIQFTRYDIPGAFYDWHQDGLEGEVASRKLSLVVQLSGPADYEGGTLELFNVENDWDASERDEWHDQACLQGSVVAFPAFEYHRVRPLTDGNRYSLVSWIGGPPFR
jgi:PKHD-type hydroxylase